MDPITNEQRAANKAKRLRNAADPNDGVTVRLFQESQFGHAGQFLVKNPQIAAFLFATGQAEHAE